MKCSELFTKDNGIFATVFKTEYPTEYAAIFGDTDPTKLDAYALLMYGGKTVVSSITGDNARDIVSAVIAVNVQGWEREAAAMLADYDVLTPVTGSVERTETVTLQESTDNTETGANKAFNDTDFSDSDRKTANDERNRTEERQTTETSKGTGASKSISTEIAKELQLRRDNWRKNIIFALIRELTTSIYE
jgi:hypothetical protein